MEILSKETIALLGNEKVREALNELLKEHGAEKVVVSVPKSGESKGEEASEDVRVVTLRRLCA